jgi:general secretion pathway protein K
MRETVRPRAARPSRRRRNRGAAVLMALFVATLATLIVTGLFWNQFVLLRTIENQQIVSQSRLLLRGALDWARAILREDSLRSSFDALTEPWAQPLAETRLDQLGETSALAAQASMAGSIEDAQSRINLRNLVSPDGQIVERELRVLRRLCTLLRVTEQSADLIAQRMQRALAPTPSGAGREPMLATDPKAPPIGLVLAHDIIGIAGIDPEAAALLAPYLVILDEPTPLNVNTAAAEVIAARIEDLSIADARALIADRERVGYFRDFGDLQNHLARFGRGSLSGAVTPQDIGTITRYFFVRGQIRLDRAQTRMEALVKRGQPRAAQPIAVLWQREL